MSYPFNLWVGGAMLERMLDLYAFHRRVDDSCGGELGRLNRSAAEYANLATLGARAARWTLEAARGARLAPEIAPTPCRVVYEEDRLKLLHYRSGGKRKFAVPVLLVSSLVNRYYILDLVPERSYVRHLLDEGFDVYAIDWGVPNDEDAGLTIEDYVDRYLPRVVKTVLRRSKAEGVSLLGYSMGGVLSLIYTALHGQSVKNLVLLTTPVDFHDAGPFRAWVDERYFDVDRFVETFGNVPAEMVRWAFRALKPASNLTRGVNLLQHADEEEELRCLVALEAWMDDGVAIPGELYRRFVKDFYRENLLARGALAVGGRTVDLSSVECPLLNVAGSHDQTVPPHCSTPLMSLVGSSDREQLILPYGHVTIAVGEGAREDFWAKSAHWLKERSGKLVVRESVRAPA